MGAGKGLPFSKEKQVNPCGDERLSVIDRDKLNKDHCVALYQFYIETTRKSPWKDDCVFFVSKEMKISHGELEKVLYSLDLDHVVKRSVSKSGINNPLNWQLIPRELNNGKKNGADYRTDEYLNWVWERITGKERLGK